jgi:hypothetical protein
MDRQQEDRVRARAHAIWEAEGRPEGRAAEHRAQAMRELAEDGSEAEEHAQLVAPTPPQGR